jgi:hypothetical protein
MKALKKEPVDTVRSSRDGHEYHEIWTARRAMQLLLPDTELCGIAVEGLSPRDQKTASKEAAEIADLTLYHGNATEFASAARTTVAQFKYSNADRETDFRASHAKTTVEKFAKTYLELRDQHGAAAVSEKLRFELVTNRPIYGPLLEALRALSQGRSPPEQAKSQAKQFTEASALSGPQLAEFAGKLTLFGRSPDLPSVKGDLSRLLIDWSGTAGDSLAAGRLGELKQMVRDKAGHAGTDKNLILRTDILTALQVSDPEDLLPCKPALAHVGPIVEREQLSDAAKQVSGLTRPLLIHASGGVGKTVFMTSLAQSVSDECEVVFFDCFGGGAYRSPSDARHLPKRGLLHIANTLAFRGLCDPILPNITDVEALLATFRRRLAQALGAIQKIIPGRSLALFLDAIDNAQLVANERAEKSFPKLLAESLFDEPIDGVKLIVSCRPERKPQTYVQFQELDLLPFSTSETTAYLRTRLKGLSAQEINVAQARSGGNARVLDYLIKADRGLIGPSEIDKKIELDELIQKRITDALSSATERGYAQKDIDVFLAGLAVLPPPVPLDEYAGANGMQLTEIESFASDLRQLFERTNQGIMFRDEPTETLVHQRYASSKDALERLSKNLWARQDSSVYAARALPYLLQKLNDTQRLFDLAFDERVPTSITSAVGKRNVRYARIKAAVLHAAAKDDKNLLVQLLVELSTVAAVDQRGASYILDHPDLAVTARDLDSMRRLYETRTSWPGTRHARLAIANTLSNEPGEAYRHAKTAFDWIGHYLRSDRVDQTDRRRPERIDNAAVPFHLIVEGHPDRAMRNLEHWRAWYAYEISEYVFVFLQAGLATETIPKVVVTTLTGKLSGIGPLAAAISFDASLSTRNRTKTLVRLARACRRKKELDFSDSYSYRSNHRYQLQDGLRKAAAQAAMLGLKREALDICLRVPHKRPGIYAFRRSVYSQEVLHLVFRVALTSAIKGTSIHEQDLLPIEVAAICRSLGHAATGKDFREKAKTRLANAMRKKQKKKSEKRDPKTISYEQKQEAESFVNHQLTLFLEIATALRDLLRGTGKRKDDKVTALLTALENARRKSGIYRAEDIDVFFRFFGQELACLVLWTSSLSRASIERIIAFIHAGEIGAEALTRIVAILASHDALSELAGREAKKAQSLIAAEDETTYRATLFAALARAILPASVEEAAAYFKMGLEQMDAIGSGDYQYTNELLLFASTLKGMELDAADAQTLSNICELNLSDEPHKFFWAAYARGMSKAAGPRGLAKLTRWDDRGRVRLEYTLLPYLIALVSDGKLSPELAISLNRLASPAEYYEFGTREFLETIGRQGWTSATAARAIGQYLDDNPSSRSDPTVKSLSELAKTYLGSTADVTRYLDTLRTLHETDRKKQEKDTVYVRNDEDPRVARQRSAREARTKRAALTKLAKKTDATDERSLEAGLVDLNSMDGIWDQRDVFFSEIRKGMPLKARSTYIKRIAATEHLNWYWKIKELQACQKTWSASSAALATTFADLAKLLVHQHAEDMVDDGRFSGSMVKEISDLTSISRPTIVRELIEVFAQPEAIAGGSVWLGFACFIAVEADAGLAQQALKRLLNSDAAALANRVPDGPWDSALDLDSDIHEIAAAMLWRSLGSADAEARWRAAHALRDLATFGCWNVIDKIVSKFDLVTAGPYQAKELTFYYLNARLWLLIALARISVEEPKDVARYEQALLRVATEKDRPHVLLRHFAAKALISCIDAKAVSVTSQVEMELRSADQSPHPRLNQKIRKGGDFYQGRPKSAPKPTFEFHLDYDFHKHDVDNLSQVFGKGCWEVADMMSEIVHALDPKITGMYEGDGRRSRRHSEGFSERYHSLGAYFGWHALFFAAGKLLRDFPVTDDWWYEANPWREWLSRYTLTRANGQWLSDGTDRLPLDTSINLTERNGSETAITGNKAKLLSLIGAVEGSKDIVINANWHSRDSIRVRVSSALATPDKVRKLTTALIKEEPMLVWLPSYDDSEEDDEYDRSGESGYHAWIVSPSREARLDGHDPYGVSVANTRPRLTKDFVSFLELARADSFGRLWLAKDGRKVVRAEAWGRDPDDNDRSRSRPGTRVSISRISLKRVLKKSAKDLVILVSLQHHEGGHRTESKYTHTIAVLCVSQEGSLRYLPGLVNHLHKNGH